MDEQRLNLEQENGADAATVTKERNIVRLIYGARLVLFAATLWLDLLAMLGLEEPQTLLMIALITAALYTVLVLSISTGGRKIRKVAAAVSILWAVWMLAQFISGIGDPFVMAISLLEVGFSVFTAIVLLTNKPVNAYLDTLVKPLPVIAESEETKDGNKDAGDVQEESAE